MEWKSYLGNRLIAEHPEGFFIIKPENYQEENTLFCPVCTHLMKTSFDDETYSKYKCCENCANRWVYKNKKEWLDGWRPTKEEIIEKSF